MATDFPKVQSVAQHPVQKLLINGSPQTVVTALSNPGLGGMAIDFQFAHQLRQPNLTDSGRERSDLESGEVNRC